MDNTVLGWEVIIIWCWYHRYLYYSWDLWPMFILYHSEMEYRPTTIRCLLYPHTTKLLGGILVSLHPSVRPSVRPASRVRSVVPTVLVGSISYLYILSSNFTRCVVCKVFCKIWQFFKTCNFDCVLFWLGIWCESLVWVIMGRRGVSQNASALVVLVVSTNRVGGGHRNVLFCSSVHPSVTLDLRFLHTC